MVKNLWIAVLVLYSQSVALVRSHQRPVPNSNIQGTSSEKGTVSLEGSIKKDNDSEFRDLRHLIAFFQLLAYDMGSE